MKNEFNPLVFKDKRKEEIQKLCYSKWVESNYKGVVVLPTACGKSMIGLMALIKHRHLTKLFIVVPKVDLMNQWYNDIIEYCKVSPENVGRIGGKYKVEGKPITIAVINSIRDKIFSSELLILDEVHGFFSKENSKFLLKGSHRRILGLTATIEKSDDSHLKFIKNLPIIYNMEQKEAVDKGLVSPYKIINIGCTLSSTEQRKYDYHDKIVKTEMRYFNYDMKEILNNMKFSNDPERKMIATSILRAIRGRKTIVANSENKLIKVIETIISLKNSKIIVFCEYIKTADYIIKELKKLKIKGAKFHSKMSTIEKEQMFDKFKNNEVSVMISVKALIEGTNIPDCDTAMIVSGNSVKKDIIQSAGRVIRVTDDKDYATIYQFYVKDTVDEKWTKKRTSHIKKAAIGVEWK